MLNFMVLVGKVKEIPEIRLTAAGTKIATMLLEVDRGFRNSNGEYDQDVFNVVLWRGVAETCADLLRPGSVVAVSYTHLEGLPVSVEQGPCSLRYNELQDHKIFASRGRMHGSLFQDELFYGEDFRLEPAEVMPVSYTHLFSINF